METFNQNAASKDDLTAYVAHSELAGLVDNEVLELLKDNGSIAKYVNEVIESQVLAETSAINLAIKGVDDKLATLSTSLKLIRVNRQLLTKLLPVISLRLLHLKQLSKQL